MMVMNKDLKTILSMKNPWWQSKTSFPETPESERYIVKDLEKLTMETALIVIGPRQSGKTTAMLQAIRRLLRNTDPFSIVYIPMDLLKDVSIMDVISTHQELTTKTKKIYYFFDEVHYDREWSVHLKTLIDSKTENYYCATGSSSTLLLKDTTESGIGRFLFKSIFPLSFREYATLSKTEPKIILNLDAPSKILSNQILLLSELKKSEPLFQKYLLWGGFPAQISQEYDISSWHNVLRQNYVSLTIYKDVLSRYEVRDPGILEDMLYLVSEKTMLPLSYDAIAKSFHLTIETARTYLNYLEAAGLIITCEYFTKNVLKRARRNKKFYLIDPGFNAAFNYETTLSDALASKNVETSVAMCLLRYLRKKTGLLHPRLFYWKNKHEVDFILQLAGKILPFEVKYKKEVEIDDLDGLIECMDALKSKKGIVITKNLAEKRKKNEKEIYLIPAPIFMLGME
jgi:predicted AAA+ superfamily ATPase